MPRRRAKIIIDGSHHNRSASEGLGGVFPEVALDRSLPRRGADIDRVSVGRLSITRRAEPRLSRLALLLSAWIHNRRVRYRLLDC